MNNPYLKLAEDLEKAFNKHSEMIVWIAKRVLPAKDYLEFINEFTEKHDKSEVLDFINQKGR